MFGRRTLEELSVQSLDADTQAAVSYRLRMQKVYIYTLRAEIFAMHGHVLDIWDFKRYADLIARRFIRLRSRVWFPRTGCKNYGNTLRAVLETGDMLSVRSETAFRGKL